MPQREFEITIEPDGSVQLHVKGYKGRSCLEAMKIFEQVVGELKSQRETSEFYEPDSPREILSCASSDGGQRVISRGERVRFNIEQGRC
jgi:hypothetical protein